MVVILMHFPIFFSLPVYYILYAKSCKHWILHQVRKFGLEAHLKKDINITVILQYSLKSKCSLGFFIAAILKPFCDLLKITRIS